jgi:hypothetical protein
MVVTLYRLFPLLQDIATVLVIVIMLSNFVPLGFVHNRVFKTFSLVVFITLALICLFAGHFINVLIYGLCAAVVILRL